MINCLHRKVEGHEFTNRFDATQSSTNGNASEASFRDWRINHPLITVLFVQSTAYLWYMYI